MDKPLASLHAPGCATIRHLMQVIGSSQCLARLLTFWRLGSVPVVVLQNANSLQDKTTWRARYGS
jgi:hypothetical protein